MKVIILFLNQPSFGFGADYFFALLCFARVQCGWIVSTGRLTRTLSGSFLHLLLYYRMRSSPISFNFRGRDLTKANFTPLVLTIEST